MSSGAPPCRYWNEDALSRWLGTENLGWAHLDGIRTRVLVDNGARVNSMMPAYVRQHNLGLRPIMELDHSKNPYGDHIPLVGLGGGQSEPLGFHITQGPDRRQSVVTTGRTQRTMMMGNRLNVMTQAPYPDDKADLPNGLYIMRTYTELKDGSRNVSLVLRNLTSRPIFLILESS